MKDVKTNESQKQMEYEEPVLLGAEDLQDVAGGCLFSCSDGSCQKK
jgi:hypothetical protein